MKTVNVRNAFSGLRGTYRATVKNGEVVVWDSIAGHYTTCHSLTAGQIKYVVSRCKESPETERPQGEKKMNAKYNVTAPKTAGAPPVVIGTYRTLKEARRIASCIQHNYLTYQDVRINRIDGALKEYAGPMR